MGTGNGIDASFGIGEEVTPGTPVTPTRWLPFDSEGIKRNKRTIVSSGLRGGIPAQLASTRRQSWRDAGGPVTLDVLDRGMGILLNHAFGSSTVTSGGGYYTHVHSIASRLGKSLTCQIGKPSSTDGVVNPFTYTGGKVSGFELTMDTESLIKAKFDFDFIDEITLAAAPTIASITQTGTAGSTTYYYRVSAILASGETSASQEVRTQTSNATLSGSNYNVVTWGAVSGATGYNVYRSTAAGAELKIASNVAGPTYSDQSNTAGSGTPKGPLLTTPSYGANASAFSFADVNTLTLGGSAVAAVKKFNVKVGRPIAGEQVFLGNSGLKSEQVDNGYVAVSGQFDAEFVSISALYAAFAADTQLALVAKASGNIITGATPYSVQVDVPALFLDGETPNVGGPERLSVTVPFTAFYDGTNSPVKLTQVTSDSAL